MIYKYKLFLFIISNLSCILLGYCYVISPSLNNAIHLYTKEKLLLNYIKKINIERIRNHPITSDFNVNKKNANVSEKNDFEYIYDFVSLLEMNGIIVKSIKIGSSSRQIYSKILQITIHSQVNQFFSFISSFTFKPYSILILDFSSQVVKQNHLLITMNILFLRKLIPKSVALTPAFEMMRKFQLNAESNHHHPFCPESGFNA